MADDEREKEIEAIAPPSPSPSSDLTLQETKEFAPITGLQGRSSDNSPARPPMSLRSASRQRSNNGYGCDDHEDVSDESGGVAAVAQTEKDPFEVQWESGDSDGMNPRSMAFGRKWLVVVIVSASSMCV